MGLKKSLATFRKFRRGYDETKEKRELKRGESRSKTKLPNSRAKKIA